LGGVCGRSERGGRWWVGGRLGERMVNVGVSVRVGEVVCVHVCARSYYENGSEWVLGTAY